MKPVTAYQPLHPETGQPWPPLPPLLIDAWEALARYPHPPESCLVNYYGPAAKMGLHQDRDECAFDAPVVSLSLGDTCLFRIGGLRRADPTRTVRLASGDAVVLGGDGQLALAAVRRADQSHPAARHASGLMTLGVHIRPHRRKLAIQLPSMLL